MNVIRIQKELIYGSWVSGEWAINYEGGFGRRGLIGNILFHFAQEYDLEIVDVIFYFKCLIYLSFFFLFIFFLKKKISLSSFAIIIAPWGLFFELNDIYGAGRKEILLMFVFITFLLFNRYSNYKDHYDFFFFFSLPFLVLIHEGLFFFFHFFLLFIFLKGALNARRLLYFSFHYGVSLLIIIFFAIDRADSQSRINQICYSLRKVTKLSDSNLNEFCAGSISHLTWAFYDLSVKYFIIYLFYGILSFVPIYWFFIKYVNRKKSKDHSFLILSLFVTLPLFIVAVDYGRWIHIICTLTALLLVEVKDSQIFRSVSRNNVYFILVGLILYSTSWSLPHWISM